MEELKKSVVGLLAKWKTTNDSRSGVWKWVVGIVLSAIVFFVVAYLSRKAFQKWHDIAGLKHKVDVLKENEHRILISKENLQHEEAIKEHNEKIKQIGEQIELIDDRIVELNKELELENAKIKAIESWDDIDKYLRDSSAND